jgi:hypothetical protein
MKLPKDWTIAVWEKAIESHALAGKMEAKELHLCLFFLSFLNRPQLLETLLPLSVESGEKLDNESIEVVFRCYLKCKWFAQAHRFLWINNHNNIAFERFGFLVDRVEKSTTLVPESNDKFLTFLRYKFGSHFPAKISYSGGTT